MLYLGDSKRCSKCKKYKPLKTAYYKNCTKKDGRDSWCRECRSASKKKYKNRVDRFWKYFWSRVREVGDCLEWQGGYAMKTTPVCTWDYKQQNVRRMVYKLALGEISDGMFVVPTCRNKRCVKHSHLTLSSKELLEAKLFDGRRPVGDRHGSRTHPERIVRGEQNSRAKLTEQDVIRIRELHRNGTPGRAIAHQFQVNETNISSIIHYKTWKHVQ